MSSHNGNKTFTQPRAIFGNRRLTRAPQATPIPPGNEAGFALLIVLWTIALLALLGSTITAAGRSETRIAGNLAAAAQVQAAADAAVAAAGYHLLDPSDQHWAADGTPHTLTIGSAAVRVTMRDQDGMVDPNESPPSLIAALLRQVGVDPSTAQSAASAIVDWRSAADTGLTPVYTAQGRHFGPPHEPFQSIDEIALVAYITPKIMNLIRGHIDPFIESTPDPALADPIVSAAIDDATKRDHLTLEPISPGGPTVVQLTATAHTGNATFTRRALLRFDPTATQPYQVLAWQQG